QVVEAGQLSRVGVEEGPGPHDQRQQAGGREQQDAAEPVRTGAPARCRANWNLKGGMASRAASPAPGGELSHGAPGKRGHCAEGYSINPSRACGGGSGVGACTLSEEAPRARSWLQRKAARAAVP